MARCDLSVRTCIPHFDANNRLMVKNAGQSKEGNDGRTDCDIQSKVLVPDWVELVLHDRGAHLAVRRETNATIRVAT